MQKLLSLMRSAIDEYNMISEGDRIAVGLSGGKDSLALLKMMSELRRFYPNRFELFAITIGMGWESMDFSVAEQFCRSIDVPFVFKEGNIGRIVFDIRKETNPCSLCAKMRRGALNDAALELGCKKVALGHHYDDAVETFMLSLLYEGRLSCFQPMTYLDRKDITVIRPMLLIPERKLTAFARRADLPVVHNPCPADKHTKREDAKQLLSELEGRYPGIKGNVFGAIKRSNLKGWQKP